MQSTLSNLQRQAHETARDLEARAGAHQRRVSRQSVAVLPLLLILAVMPGAAKGQPNCTSTGCELDYSTTVAKERDAVAAFSVRLWVGSTPPRCTEDRADPPSGRDPWCPPTAIGKPFPQLRPQECAAPQDLPPTRDRCATGNANPVDTFAERPTCDGAAEGLYVRTGKGRGPYQYWHCQSSAYVEVGSGTNETWWPKVLQCSSGSYGDAGDGDDYRLWTVPKGSVAVAGLPACGPAIEEHVYDVTDLAALDTQNPTGGGTLWAQYRCKPNGNWGLHWEKDQSIYGSLCQGGSDAEDNWKLNIPNDVGTVADMPTCDTSRPGHIYRTEDSSSLSDCSVGGGDAVNDCYCDGAAWSDAGRKVAGLWIPLTPTLELDPRDSEERFERKRFEGRRDDGFRAIEKQLDGPRKRE